MKKILMKKILNKTIWFLISLTFVLYASCNNPDSSKTDTGYFSPDTDSSEIIDSDFATNTDANIGTDSGSDTITDFNSDTGTDIDSDKGTDTVTDTDSDTETDKVTDTDSDTETDKDPGLITADTCIYHMADLAACKDCCDCMNVSCEAIIPCRQECETHNFLENINIISVDIPSELGENGDYSICSDLATQQECKSCCECTDNFVCGDFRHCRDTCANLPAQK